MSHQSPQRGTVRSNSPTKYALDGPEDGDRATKRQRVASVKDSAMEITRASSTSSSEERTSSLAPLESGLKGASNVKRMAHLNLKNYPSNHHPVGIAIWIVQKLEQARRYSEPHSSVDDSTDHNEIGNSAPAPGRPPTNFGHAMPAPSENSSQWQGITHSGYMPLLRAEEQEAERLQSQRNRKTKQRQENWAKNKENDVVARAKVEAKKKFGSDVSDADQQIWLEERIKTDFGRFMDRIALQLNNEIVGLPPFQLGFAEYFFNAENNPRDLDDQTIFAGRLIAATLPALAENHVSPQSRRAVDSLISALETNNPRLGLFNIAFHVLVENHEMMIGIDKVLLNLFTPKTGPQLARKRASLASDKLSSTIFSTGPYSAITGSAPIWHWKEPATIANSTRFNMPTQNSPSYSDFAIARDQAWSQYPQQPYALVQAGVFQPPPQPRAKYLYDHQEGSQTASHTISSDRRLTDNAFDGRYYSGSTEMDKRSIPHTIPPSKHVDTVPYPALPSSALGLRDGGQLQDASVNGEGADSIESHKPSNKPKKIESDVSDSEAAKPNVIGPEVVSLSSKADTVQGAMNELGHQQSPLVKSTKSPAKATKFISRDSTRRRSSRDRVLTTKALAAGILLGQSQNATNSIYPTEEATLQPEIPEKSPEPGLRSSGRGRKLSLKALVAYESSQATLSKNPQKPVSSVPAVPVALPKSPESPGESVMPDSPVPAFLPNSPEPQQSSEEVVPRSSGRERKPTAKVLAAKNNMRSKARSASPVPVQQLSKTVKISNSVPKVSSKLRLSVSSREPSPSVSTTLSVPSNSQDSLLEEHEEGPAVTLSNNEAALPIDDTNLPAKSSVKDRSLTESTIILNPATESQYLSTSRTTNQDVIRQEQSHQNSLAAIPSIYVTSHSSVSQIPKRTPSRLPSQQAQTLLLMASIAADWPDSDDDDQPELEHVFQAELARALLSSTEKEAKELPNLALATSYGQTRYEATLPNGFSVPGINQPQLHSIAPYWQNDGLIANTRNLHKSNSLNKASGDAHIPDRSPFRSIEPSAALPALSSSLAVLHQNQHVYQYVGYPSFAHWSPPAHYSTPQMAGSDPSRSQMQATPEAGGTAKYSSRESDADSAFSNGWQATSAGKSQPIAQFSSQYKFNPIGLNGGPPGGGTIINGPPPKFRPKRKSRKSLLDASGSTDGSMDEHPNSVEAENGSNGSLTPQPQSQPPPRPKFKKGGHRISFEKH